MNFCMLMRKGMYVTEIVAGVLQPTGCSGVPALPAGRPAQRSQQGHCEAEGHHGGL